MAAAAGFNVSWVGAPTNEEYQFPKYLYGANYAPDNHYYSQYRTYTDPNTGEVKPTSWGSNDSYGNYRASYIAPGFQSNFYGDAPSGGPAATASAWGSAASGFPAPYVPNPIQFTQSGTTGIPALPSTQPGSSGSSPDQSGSQGPPPAQPAAQPTPWDLWQQQSASATAAPPPTAQIAPTVRKEGARNSVLANAVLQGGTQYQPGKNAAGFNQDVADYQQQQNEFATTYQLMLQRLAQEAGGQTSYTPGATG